MRVAAVLGGICSLLVLAAGCGGGSTDTTTAVTTASTTATTSTTESSETATTETTSTTTDTSESETTDGAETSTTERTASTSRSDGSSAGKGDGIGLSSGFFRTPGNKIACGFRSHGGARQLVCVRADVGAAVTLGPRGRASTSVSDDNRGLPPAARKAAVLRTGKTVSRYGFTCRAKKKTVRCVNGANHGFELGSLTVFRF